MNTSFDFLLSLKQKGRETADKWLNNEFEKVGERSTFDVEEHFFEKF
jgi:NTE family protein